jgi:LacI family transcriptional regulator
LITIQDIANKAGVSATTVSNVINGKINRVSPKTLEKINSIIEKSGYVPNLSARMLVSNSSRVVAIINIVENDSADGFLSDPFLSSFISAAEQTLREKGYYIMFRAVKNADDLNAFLRGWAVDGLFATGVFDGSGIVEALRESKKPVVLIDSYIKDLDGLVNIGLEDEKGAFIATKFLAESGHKRIVFAGAKIKPGGVVFKRFSGYKGALADAGIEFDASLVFEREFSTTETIALGREIAALEGVTAVFATADIMAAGIMTGLRESGKNVPGDISVMGFDDIFYSRLTNPKLTTIHQNMQRKGQVAADIMVGLLCGVTDPRLISSNKIVLPISLVERESVRIINS